MRFWVILSNFQPPSTSIFLPKHIYKIYHSKIYLNSFTKNEQRLFMTWRQKVIHKVFFLILVEDNISGVVGLLFFCSPHDQWPALAYFHLATYLFLSPKLCCFSNKTPALANFNLWTRQTFEFYLICFF